MPTVVIAYSDFPDTSVEAEVLSAVQPLIDLLQREDDVRGRAEAPATRGPLGDPAAPGAAGPAAPEGAGTAGSQAVGPEADRSSGNTG